MTAWERWHLLHGRIRPSVLSAGEEGCGFKGCTNPATVDFYPVAWPEDWGPVGRLCQWHHAWYWRTIRDYERAMIYRLPWTPPGDKP